MPDVSVRTAGRQAVAGREAGNSVVIDHGEGWETQYSHLRKGSVAVRAGDVVQRGQPLGAVGLSGNTEFAHLHFEVRHRGKAVDPFVGLEATKQCQAGEEPLWQQQTLGLLSYVATGVLDAGISGAPPSLSDGSVDPQNIERFSALSRAAVFWVHIYGAQANDIEEFSLIGPDGSVIAARRGRIERNRAQWLAYVGKKQGGSPWASGRYQGKYVLTRPGDARKVVSIEREIEL
jgi:hypothetical protein